jgi:hypothetical protein
VPVVNPTFKIPAGADNYQVESRWTFKEDGFLLGFMPHMHLRGKDFFIEVIHPDGTKEALLSVPKFDFGWQSAYRLEKPYPVKKGGVIHCVAHFDNSEKNPNNPNPKVEVRWGDQTWEEMMIGWFTYALTLIKPGTWGPKLIRHADGPPCDVSGRQNPTTGIPDPSAAVFPTDCESATSVPGKNGRIVQGSRNTTMALLAESLGRMGRGGRPVVDRTGITDRIDYRLEWTPEPNGPGIRGMEVEPDPNPVTFMDAVREQLGLKLQSTKAPLRILVIDHIERPSEN